MVEVIKPPPCRLTWQRTSQRQVEICGVEVLEEIDGSMLGRVGSQTFFKNLIYAVRVAANEQTKIAVPDAPGGISLANARVSPTSQ